MINRLPLSDEQIEQIRLYLSGQASAELREEIEQEIERNADFAKEVQQFRFLMEGLKSVHDKDMRAKIASWEQERKADQGKDNSNKHTEARVLPMTRWYRYTAVAAVALLLVLAIGRWSDWFGNSPKTYDELLAENLTELPMPSLLRGGDAPTDSLSIWYRTGISYYSMQKYGEAITYLEKCVGQDSLPSDIRVGSLDLFLGVSYLLTEQTDKAESTFLRIPDTGLYQLQKEWFLAMAYLQAQDTIRLKKQLAFIKSQDKHPYQQRAKSLLERLPE